MYVTIAECVYENVCVHVYASACVQLIVDTFVQIAQEVEKKKANDGQQRVRFDSVSDSIP